MTFKLTYSTMFSAPEELHQRFEEALGQVRTGLGATLPLFIGGQDVLTRGAVDRLGDAQRPDQVGLRQC